MANMSAHEYTKTYTTFGGCDIVPTFNGKVIGEIQAITYSLTREKVPVYTMGSAEPRSFSRGKRGIAGNLVFISFNRDALLAEIGDHNMTKFKANDPAWLKDKKAAQFISIEQWDHYMSDLASSKKGGDWKPGEFGVDDSEIVGYSNDLWTDKAKPKYADEIYPFDITISLANEYGNKAITVIYGVEILNEGIGFSIDSPTSERAYTFVARSVDTMKPIDEDDLGMITTTW
jgi:hypothetical protein